MAMMPLLILMLPLFAATLADAADDDFRHFDA
jgi:hypothetical protein